MAYLIDGSNFLGWSAPGGHRDPQARYGLVIRLLSFQKETRSRVKVVFDGRPDPLLEDEHFSRREFSVLFPPPGESADSVIREILSSSARDSKVFVVSSDRGVRDFGRSRGASLLTCQEFNRTLRRALREQKAKREMAKNAAPPSSPLETDLWQEIFKGRKR